MSRKVISVTEATPTIEGAGVRLHRAFGREHPRLDPFLLLDDFSSDQPDDYLAGFPWHPHRGIETITYILEGLVEHGDSMGNQGTIGVGEVQWMTAGGGIVHQEMPQRSKRLVGFQLWANLPAADKMMPPRYRDVKQTDIPTAQLADGVTARVICGTAGGVTGPVRDIVTGPQYLDVTLAPGAALDYPAPPECNILSYLISGRADFGAEKKPASHRSLVIFGDGDSVRAAAGPKGARFLLVSGRPIREPVAWRGPIVMNTWEEIELAYAQLDAGTFIKKRET